MALKRLDNMGIVVEDLEGTIEFFRELGLVLEVRAMVEGEGPGTSLDWATSVSRSR